MSSNKQAELNLHCTARKQVLESRVVP